MEPKKREVVFYRDQKGREPAKDWITSLKDRHGKARILERMDRAQFGNFGDHKSLGDGISELRIASGPGYRLYFSFTENDSVLLLLICGDKSSQPKDIARAKLNWKDYKNGPKN